MSKKKRQGLDPGSTETPEYGNPTYSSGEDIYSKEEKLPFVEEGSDASIDEDKTGHALTGEDLDVPGAELDDAGEDIGQEDEENNYYSLGGDDHDDLEENRTYSSD